MEAFANALSRVLDGDDGAATEEIGKGKPAAKRGFGIDLDNLQLEELDPASRAFRRDDGLGLGVQVDADGLFEEAHAGPVGANA